MGTRKRAGRWTGLVALAVVLALLVPTAGVAADEPRVEYWFGDHHYLVVEEGMTWNDAAEHCTNNVGMMAYLVTINSAEENQFIFDLYPGWLGASDQETEGDWRWVTGEPFDYTNWDGGEPNDCGGPGCPTEDYLTFAYHDGPVPEWNDVPGGEPGFVCESSEPVLPYRIDELYVEVGDTVRLAGRWGACTIGLARAATKALELTWTLDGDPMAISGAWSDPIRSPIDPNDDYCIGNAPYGGWVYWEVPVSFDEPGTHEVGLTYYATHRLPDGGSPGGEPPPAFTEPGIVLESSMVIHAFEP